MIEGLESGIFSLNDITFFEFSLSRLGRIADQVFVVCRQDHLLPWMELTINQWAEAKVARYRPSSIISTSTARFAGGRKPGFGPVGIGRKGLPILVGRLPGQTYLP
jgi:hypothetical protein